MNFGQIPDEGMALRIDRRILACPGIIALNFANGQYVADPRQVTAFVAEKYRIAHVQPFAGRQQQQSLLVGNGHRRSEEGRVQ